MNPVMYLITDPKLGMSRGKFGAQAAHAAVEAYQLGDMFDERDEALRNAWYVGGHYTKVVLQADDLYAAKHYIEERGFKCVLIIDEGRTEFGGNLTPTFIGVSLVDKDDLHTQETFSTFKLYKDPKPPAPPTPKVIDFAAAKKRLGRG